MHLESSVSCAPLHLVLEVLLALCEVVMDDHDLGRGRIGPGAGHALSMHVQCVVRLGIVEGVGIL